MCPDAPYQTLSIYKQRLVRCDFFQVTAFLIMFAQQNNYASLVAGKRSFKREAARSTALAK